MEAVSLLPKDLILFALTLPAYEIAELSCGVSSDSGVLSKLGVFLTDCEESGEFEGYQSAVSQSDEILATIHDTVFTDSLERYGHHSVLALFEQNRPLYEIRIEVGRRLVSPDLVGPGEHKLSVERFHKQFGPEFVQEFIRRLESHGLDIG